MAISINGSTGISGVNGSAATPAIQGGDADTGIFFGTDTASVATAGSERLIVDASGNINIDSGGVYYDAANNRLGVGTTTAESLLTLKAANANALFIKTADSNYSSLALGINSNINAAYIQSNKSGSGTEQDLAFYGASSEWARFDTSGRLLVGTSSARTVFGTTSPKLLIESTSDTDRYAQFAANRNTANGFGIYLLKSRGTTNGSNTAVQSGDSLGFIAFQGTDGTARINTATIESQVDGTPGTNDMPGRLVFSTCASGLSSPTERARITEKGEFQTGLTQGSNNILRQIARDAGNASETFTAGNMGMNDNCTALINISIGGTLDSYGYGGCLLYWYMPRGTGSTIHQTIVPAFKGAGITTFSISVTVNSLVVTKDSDQGVFVTVIGGGGTSIF